MTKGELFVLIIKLLQKKVVTLSFRSKVLTLEKSQINLDFCSLIRTFAAQF